MKQKKVVILGSTGSIGKSALSLFDSSLKNYKVLGLSAGSNAGLLNRQIEKYRPSRAAIMDTSASKKVKAGGAKVYEGMEGLVKLATLKEADIVLLAVVGAAGIIPLISAIRAGKKIALANKEALVIAGDIISKELKKTKAELIPVDSEHSAIFQALAGHKKDYVKRFIITASGGRFKNFKKSRLKNITVKQALRHPTWKMGKKITIDSGTLMNKGLEVIEAHYLFGIPYEKIDVVIHPQSIIHSMVEYIDGSVIAQMSLPDMKLPIMYALTFPEKAPSAVKPIRFTDIKKLTFARADRQRFRALGLAVAAGKKGGTMPACMNAANETAVEAFLNKKIRFDEIIKYVEKTMKKHKNKKNAALEDILKTDLNARAKTKEMIKNA